MTQIPQLLIFYHILFIIPHLSCSEPFESKLQTQYAFTSKYSSVCFLKSRHFLYDHNYQNQEININAIQLSSLQTLFRFLPITLIMSFRPKEDPGSHIVVSPHISSNPELKSLAFTILSFF